MKTYETCLACIEKSVTQLARRLADRPERRERIVRVAMAALPPDALRHTPPFLAQLVHRAIRHEVGIDDYYRTEKEQSTLMALEAYPQLRRRIEKSDRPFATAVRIALAGNIIDFGLELDTPFEKALERMLTEGPVIDHTDRLQRALSRSEKVLFIGDNAGETVTDRLLIEQFDPGVQVDYAVRGGPILNDATSDDARAAGLEQVARIVGSGSDAPGVLLDDCSAELRRAYAEADMVISKGMGNFETLHDRGDQHVFFLLIAKCEHVARTLGCRIGQAAVMEQRPSQAPPAD